MAVAGKVAITLSTENGGVWSADVTYDRLVAVKHNNNLYISRKTVANVEPPNDEFWFLALEGFSGDDIEDIITGTTQVGNSKTLDGHGAEYFVEKTKETLTTSILEKALTLDNGMHNFVLAGYGNYLGDDLPHAVYAYGNATVEKRSNEATVILWGRLNSPIAVNYYAGEWSGWQTLATLADLANYLPLVNSASPEVQTNSSVVLRARNTSGNANYIHYIDTVGSLGYLGYSEANVPVAVATGGTIWNLLHSGNKPTGTYTGNGDATSRTVNVGGIGTYLMISIDDAIAFVRNTGALVVANGKTEWHGYNEIKYENGILTIASTSAYFNGSGIGYKYVDV